MRKKFKQHREEFIKMVEESEEEVTSKLKSIGLFESAMFIASSNKCAIDMADFNFVIKGNKIVNYFYDFIDATKDIDFKLNSVDNSYAIVVVESKRALEHETVGKIMKTLKSDLPDVKCIYSCFHNRKMPRKKIKVFMFNTCKE